MDAGPCTGLDTTVQTIASDTLPDMSFVSVTSAVASTAKLQITNGCLWGLYVKDPSAVAGLMLVSQGAKQTVDGGTVCTPGTDQIPDVVPGDLVSFKGKITHYTLANCMNVPKVIEIAIEQVEGCSAQKTGAGTAPEPIEATQAELKAGIKYASLLVKVTGVTAQDWPDGGVLDPLGSILLAGDGLVVRDSLYYRTQGMPQFTSGQSFTQIVGINGFPNVFNGTCSWSLAPRNKCTDFLPKSADCP